MADAKKSPSAWDEADPTQKADVPVEEAPAQEDGETTAQQPDTSEASGETEMADEADEEQPKRPAGRRGIKAWLGRHKILFVVILLLTALFVYNVVNYFTQAAAASGSGYQFVRTTTLKKTSLDNSVTVTGTVASGSTASVTVADAAKLYKVTTVNVAVGDEVKEGAVICQLDTSEVEKNIAKAKQDYADTLQSAQTSYARAQDDYTTYITQHDNTLIDLQEKIEQADKALSEAQADQKTAQDAYNSAKSTADGVNGTVSALQAAYNACTTGIAGAKATYGTAVDSLAAAAQSLNNAGSLYTTAYMTYTGTDHTDPAKESAALASLTSAARALESAWAIYGTGSITTLVPSAANARTVATATAVTIAEANTQLAAASTGITLSNPVSSQLIDAYNNAVNALITAETSATTAAGGKTYDQIVSEFTQAQQQQASAQQALTQAETAKKTADKTVESAELQVTSAHDAYDNEKNYSSLKNKNQTLEDAKTKLTQSQRTPDTLTTLYQTQQDCTLTATMSGTITALNATVGSVCSSTVATIQDTDGLTVNVTISADKVPGVKTGMPCYITADTTDQTLTGTLTQIDPVANDKGTFGAKVTVLGDGSALLIGTQARVEIMESQTGDVFVVPLDAVGTAEDGSSFVYRQNGGEGVDMTFEQVTVTPGKTNDYYVEISGDTLADGDVIRSSADLKEGIETGNNTQDLTSMMMGDGVEMSGPDDTGDAVRPNRTDAGPGGM